MLVNGSTLHKGAANSCWTDVHGDPEKGDGDSKMLLKGIMWMQA